MSPGPCDWNCIPEPKSLVGPPELESLPQTLAAASKGSIGRESDLIYSLGMIFDDMFSMLSLYSKEI